MPNLLVMSFEGLLSPSFTLHQTEAAGRPDGWGVGYYGHGEESATVFKEATPPHGERRPTHAPGVEQLASSQFIVQVRKARWGSEDRLANTQPFLRSWRGRDWVFGHAGSLDHRIEVPGERLFEPVGTTDSELLFCELLNNIADRRWRNLGYADFALMQQWCAGFNDYGKVSVVLSDGRDLVVYADRDTPLYMWTLTPPHGSLVFRGQHLEIDLAARGVKSQKGLLITSDPIEPIAGCKAVRSEIAPGSLLVLREGAIHHAVEPSHDPGAGKPSSPTVVVRGRVMDRPRKAPVRTFDVLHEHHLQLQQAGRAQHPPAAPRARSTIACSGCSPRAQHLRRRPQARVRRRLRQPAASCCVDTPVHRAHRSTRSARGSRCSTPIRSSFRPLHARTTIPLVWMPWQRHMLSPTCSRPSCPRPSSSSCTDYAMSFVRRNDYDLLDTLLDINSHDLQATTSTCRGDRPSTPRPFEVYDRRRGVCQDFTNLFICLARLLGVPARYVCGYIYTGPKHAQSSDPGRGLARVGRRSTCPRSAGRASTRPTAS